MDRIMLKTKRLSIVPTLRCTLNCKLCSNHMPDFKNPYELSYEQITKDIDKLFELFDYIEWLQFVGGEIFMVKHMARVYDYCLKYKDKFTKLILETNATVPPREEEIEVLKKYGENCEVMISDYGPLSRSLDLYINAFEKNGINYRLKKYWGDVVSQYYGGWIDNSKPRFLGESDEVVAELTKDCSQVKLENMHCFNGKLHRCANSLFTLELGVYTPKKDDYVDLYDDTISKDAKRDIINGFYKKPRTSCYYCSWKNNINQTEERFSAAEQL